MIVLCADAKIGLNGECALQRFEREIYGTETGAGRSQSVVNVRCFRFALKCSLKHLLRRNVFAAIQFDDAAVVERIGVAGKHAFRSQPRFRDRQIRPSAGGHFRNL